MEKTAIDKVQDIPHALLGLADQAIAMKRYDLVAEIIEYLPNTVKMRRKFNGLNGEWLQEISLIGIKNV